MAALSLTAVRVTVRRVFSVVPIVCRAVVGPVLLDSIRRTLVVGWCLLTRYRRRRRIDLMLGIVAMACVIVRGLMLFGVFSTSSCSICVRLFCKRYRTMIETFSASKGPVTC